MSNIQTEPAAARLLTRAEVQARTTLGKTSLWRLIRAGKFPASISVIGSRRAWREADVTAWIEGR